MLDREYFMVVITELSGINFMPVHRLCKLTEVRVLTECTVKSE